MSTYYVQCIVPGEKTKAIILLLKAYVTIAKGVGQAESPLEANIWRRLH